MEESGDLISSLYPPPPPFVRFHTDDNLKRLKEWQENSQTSNADPSSNPTSISPPGELKFLIPPKQPSGEHYRGYGNIWLFEDKLPSLQQMGLQQLYPENDEGITLVAKIKELHKLLDLLLLNFLELVGVVSVEPEKFGSKIDNIRTILINMNHLLNSYRPHQSRESLILLLKKQIEKKQQEIRDIDTTTNSITANLTQTLEELGNKALDLPATELLAHETTEKNVLETAIQETLEEIKKENN